MIAQTTIGTLTDLFGKTHPALAHVPVGLLLIAVVAEAIALLKRNSEFHFAGKFCLIFGTAGAILTSVSGFPLTTLVYSSYAPPMLLWHKYMGIGVAAAGGLTSLLALLAGKKMKPVGKVRILYFLILLLIAGLVMATGHTGGMLVYGENYYSIQ